MRVVLPLKVRVCVSLVSLLFSLFAFSVFVCASTNLFPHKGDLYLPQGTTVIPENAVTGIEEGNLYIPAGATLQLEDGATFIWNPGYSIHNDGKITIGSDAQLRQGYLCVLLDTSNGCWHDPTFFASLPCPSGYVRWKDVSNLPSCNDEVVNFPDPHLEQAIREAINKPTGDIYVSDLEGLTHLNAYSRNITDLEGIQHCTNLTSLDLHFNQISDLTPLSSLTNLTELDLRGNQIVDISPLLSLANLTNLNLEGNQIVDINPLSGLANLGALNLGGNEIVDLSPLSGLTNLTWLSLFGNEIVDISPLSGLTNLETLNLGGNEIVDLSPLSGLTNLTKLTLNANKIDDISPLSGLTNLTGLALNWNEIVDISPLSGLTNLTTLELYGNQIVDTSPLSGLTNLETLNLGGNEIVDLSPLSGLTNLMCLDLMGNQIVDISPLSGLTNLTWLSLFGNEIVDISPLSGLTNLGALYLGSNEIVDISPLSRLTNLETLNLGGLPSPPPIPLSEFSEERSRLGMSQINNVSPLSELALPWPHSNKIVDISPLSGLTNLTWLDLMGNQIVDISPLSGLTNLTWLDLSYNRIVDISPLSGLTNLTELDLSYNRIVDISPLSGLTNLTWLDLMGNQIGNISPLIANSGLASGDSVDLRNNYLDVTSGSDDMQNIQALIDRGVNVEYEPQNPPENHPPIAHATDISGQPQMMYPNTTYTVTAKYFDPDGRQDLKICYLRLNHPTKPLTMMWYQVDGHTSTYAGEEGANYLTKVEATASKITDADGTQGYEIKWTFEINNKWPEVQSAIDFGVFASDNEGRESGWDYTNTNASFRSIFLVITSPLKISPAQNIYSVGDSILATFTIENRGPVPVSLTVLTVGGRLNGSCLPGGCPDFTHRSITLGAGESYQYEGHLTLSHTGTYHFFCVYKLNGVWNTNISVELNGQIVEDPAVVRRCREADIRVIEGATISTALGPASWEPIKGPWDKWPEDKLGSSWNIIQAIAVNPKNPNEIYVAATHRTNNWWEPEGSRLYKSVDGGKSWSDISEGLPRLHLSSYYWPIGAIAIAPSNPNVVYVGTTDFDPNNVDILAGPSHSMGVYKTINGGQSWLEWNGGSQLSPPPGSTPPIVIPSFPTAYSVSSMTVDPTNADIVYVGTVGGGIWSTVTVGGEIGWQQVWKPRGRLLYNVNSLAISPDNPSTIYAAAYNYAPYSDSGFSGLAFHGGLYKYTNGAWQNINNKRRIDDIVITKQNTNNIFIITNSYEAFQSVDGGMTWQDITGKGEDSLPQVYLDLPYAKPSYSLEMDPNSKWLFAASPFETQAMGVYFSPNLGRNWFPIGLQDESVTQLALASTSEHHILYAVTTRSTQEDVHLFKYEFSNSAVVVERGSPVEVRVYDTDGHVSGVVNGQQKAEIPKSLVVGETIVILSSTGPYKYEVFGTGKGTYNLDITSIHNNNVLAFVATNIPTHRGSVHKYTIDWNTLAQGKNGTTLQIDDDGNGIFERTITAGSEISGEDFGVVPNKQLVNYGPNPIPPEGCIFWLNLPNDAVEATLKIFDIDGADLMSIPLDLTADRYPAAGRWIPEDNQGRLLGTGLYLYLVEIKHADGTVTYSPVQKMVIER